MALTAISVILQVCVLKLHHCGPHQTPVPKWLKCLILKYLARLIRCNCKKQKRQKDAKRLLKNKNNSMSAEEGADMCLRLVNETHVTKQSPVAEFRSQNAHGNRFTSPSSNNLGHHDPYTDVTSQSVDVTSELKRLMVMEEILKYLKIMVAKRDVDDDANLLMEEWREVAQVTDRFLFWVFLSITAVATLVIIVLIPLFAAY
jgi:nicotinic acetylcholine receptor